MKFVLLLVRVLVLVLLSHPTLGYRYFNGSCPGVPDLDLVVVLDVDASAVFHRVDPRFLSVTIDASLAAEERFMLLLRYRSRIRTRTCSLTGGEEVT